LEPANPNEREIVVPKGSDFSVLGVACGVFRPFSEMEVVDDAGSRPLDA
jgi:hypothetical protein